MSTIKAIASYNHSVTEHYFKNNYFKVNKLCKGKFNYAKNVKVSKWAKAVSPTMIDNCLQYFQIMLRFWKSKGYFSIWKFVTAKVFHCNPLLKGLQI